MFTIPYTSANWAVIENLVAEQQFVAAHQQIKQRYAQAKAANNPTEQTRAIIESSKLYSEQGEFEKAITALDDKSLWPKDQKSQVILSLYHANAISKYINRHNWEINNRETIKSQQAIPINKLTMAQLAEKANQSFLIAWQGQSHWRNADPEKFKHYFDPGTYPIKIRGTFIDTLTYLWVDFIANERLWSPTQANQKNALKVATLLAASGNNQAASFADQRTHPLLRISALLNKLKQWHQQHQHPEAAMEAGRAHIAELYKHFNSRAKKAELRKALQARINAGKSQPWSTMLQNSLAEYEKDAQKADSLIRAKSILEDCAASHVGSEGNKRCQSLLAEIKHPTFIMESMTSDGIQKRSVRVNHKNINTLYFRAWKMNLDNLIKWNATEHQRQNRQLENHLASNKADAQWQVDLPATKDYRTHNTYVTPPMQEHGMWLIAASDDASFDKKKANIASAYLNLSGLVADVTTLNGVIEVTAYNGENGQLIPGATVELLDGENTPAGNAKTDNRGKATLQPKSGKSYSVILRHKGDSVLINNVYAYTSGNVSQETRGLVFTDRSVYRPAQSLQWKVIAYNGDARKGDFRVMPNSKGWVKLLDAHGTEVAKQNVTTNAYGSVSGTFELKAGANLGDWWIESSWTEGYRSHLVKVEEYKRPTFTVKFNDTTQALYLGKKTKITGNAQYLFGQAVTQAEIQWRITRSQEYSHYYWQRPPSNGSETIASGTAKPDKNGLFHIEFAPEAGDTGDDDGNSVFRFRVEADVTDAGGETRSTARSWRIGEAAIKANIELASTFIEAGKPLPVTFKRSDLNNAPRTGQASWVLHQIQQPAAPVLPADSPVTPAKERLPYATPGDKLKPRWTQGISTDSDIDSTIRNWTEGKVVNRGTLHHDAKGNATTTITKLPAGIYRLRYSTKDDQGKVFKTHRDITVVSAQPSAIPVPIMLKVKSDKVEAGKHIEMLVGSGFTQTPATIDIYQGNKKIQSNVITGGIRRINFPVTKAHYGGLHIHVSAVKDYQHLSTSQAIEVPWSDRQLDVSFSTFRDKLKPGQKEIWRVTVKDPHGRPLQKGMAGIVASMYDKSLDFFSPHNVSAIESLYHQQRTDLSLDFSQGSRRANILNRPPRPKDVETFKAAQLVEFSSQLMHGHPAIPFTSDSIAHTHKGGNKQHSHRYSAKRMAAPRPAPQRNYQAIAMAAMDAGEAVTAQSMTGQGNLSYHAVLPIVPGTTTQPSEADPIKVRTHFNETAFFYPNLILGDNGSVIFEFEAPESLTEWKVWATAITRDMRGGSASESVHTSKDLMVRPYLPRFLREGDQAEIEVAINNTSDKPLVGQLDFDIIDPDSKQSRAADFQLTNTQRTFRVKAGESTNLRFAITTPKDPGLIAIRTQATSGSLSDGEQRPLAILPSRMHLIESRFAVLNDNQPKTLSFPELAKNTDATRQHDKLVVNVEGQLFYSMLNALPYLVEYPYECTEQTLNRYLSTAILQSVIAQNPITTAVMKQMAARNTPLEPLDNKDANRSLLLEETPWLSQAQGGKTATDKLINILDPKAAAQQRDDSLEKLREAQTDEGGFPWWAGGPASPTITLYQLKGFARALEFGSDIPKDRVQAAWKYLHAEYKDKSGQHAYLRETTMIAYLLTTYPDGSWTGQHFSPQDRSGMLSFSFQNRSKLPRSLKLYLAMALHRSNRKDEAKQLFATVMDGAKTDETLGTYWKPDKRSWLWSYDTTTSHALALRTMTEIAPQDPRRKSLVQWLLLDKKLSHWKSTRATAESIYALVHYLKHEKQAFQPETTNIQIGNTLNKTLTFKPTEYIGGDQQLVVNGADVKADMAHITVKKQSNNPLPMFASANWHYSTEALPAKAKGDFLNVTRRFYKRIHNNGKWTLLPLKEGAVVRVGDQVEVQLVLQTKHEADYVHLRSPRGAGFEPIEQNSGFKWDSGVGYHQEIRDSGANYFFERLPAGKVEFKYRLRATTAGQFRVAPATLQSIYAPEFTAYSRGMRLQVEKGEF